MPKQIETPMGLKSILTPDELGKQAGVLCQEAGVVSTNKRLIAQGARRNRIFTEL